MFNKFLILFWYYYNQYYNKNKAPVDPVWSYDRYRPRPAVSSASSSPSANNNYLVVDSNSPSNPPVEYWGSNSNTASQGSKNFIAIDDPVGEILEPSPILGGLGDSISIDNPELSAALDQKLNDINALSGYAAVKYTLINYKQQIVAGINYYAKVRVDYRPDFIHVKLHRNFGGEYTVLAIEHGHTEFDVIEFF